MINTEFKPKFEEALANGLYGRWLNTDFVNARKTAYRYLMLTLDPLVGHIRISLNIDIHGGPR